MDDGTACALVARAQAGDLAARNELVEAWLPLCRFTANRIWQDGLQEDLEDLESAAQERLMEYVIPQYDQSQSVPFRRWAQQQLRGHLVNIRRKQAWRAELLRQGAHLLGPVLAGKQPTPPDACVATDLARVLTQARDAGIITEQQYKCLEMQGRGLGVQTIAARLGICRAQVYEELQEGLSALQEAVQGC